MPQKFRQRGRKKRREDSATNTSAQEVAVSPSPLFQKEASDHPAQPDIEGAVFLRTPEQTLEGGSQERYDQALDYDSAPFGMVPPELKAYLKTACTRFWQLESHHSRFDGSLALADTSGSNVKDGEADLLCLAMLREMDGHELACATDNDSSMAFEAVAESLDSRRLRILADRLSGNIGALAQHRFGSHVLQAILRRLQKDLSVNGSREPQTDANGSAGAECQGVLRTAEQLVIDFALEIVPQVQRLLQSTFGTHVLRSMLNVLAGNSVQTLERSKKSSAFRARHEAPSSSSTAIADESENSSHPNSRGKTWASSQNATSMSIVPTSGFSSVLTELRRACLPADSTGQNETRALLVSTAASPTFALLLSMEAQTSASLENGSLADTVLEGLISDLNDSSQPASKDGVETLLRHPCGSHALQALLHHLPSHIVSQFWSIYIIKKVARLASHPIANFVVATAARRLDCRSVQEALMEIEAEDGCKFVKESRTGVLVALMARAAWFAQKQELPKLASLALSASLSAFNLNADEDTQDGRIVKAIAALKTKDGWSKMIRRREERTARGDAPSALQSRTFKRKREDEQSNVLRPEEATIQGSLLLQALARLSEESHSLISQSLVALPETMAYACNPVTSHIYLVALNSPTATLATRRRLLSHLTPSIIALLDDKYGSRIADTIWNRLDGYSREKLMRDVLAQQERDLVGSHYGRFFAVKRCNMALWRRDTRKWKAWDAEQRSTNAVQGDTELSVSSLAHEAADKSPDSNCNGASTNGNRIVGDEMLGGPKDARSGADVTTEEQDLDAILADI